MPHPHPVRELSDEERTAFASEGAVYLPECIDADWVPHLVDAAARELMDPGPDALEAGPPGQFLWSPGLQDRLPAMQDWAMESPLSTLVAPLVEATALVATDVTLVVKEPGTPLVTPWHQTVAMQPAQPPIAVSVWLALDAMLSDSGSPRVVQASHRWGRRFEPRPVVPGAKAPTLEDAVGEPAPEPAAAADEAAGDWPAQCWELVPGDLVAIHPWALWGAAGNMRSDVRSRGVLVHLCQPLA